MTDEEKMKLARECAAKTFDDRARNFPSWSKTERHYANAIRQGERDYYDEVQSALAAINALLGFVTVQTPSSSKVKRHD